MTDATELNEAAVRARCEAATEGPWFGSAGGLHVYGATPGDEVAELRRPADADFVRHARTDLPAALDEITRLRAALDEARAERDRWQRRADQNEEWWRREDARAEAAEKERDDAERRVTAALTETLSALDRESAALARAEAAESALAAVRALDFDVSLGDVLSVMPKCHKRDCYCNGTGDGEPQHVVIAVANAYRAAIGRLLAVLPAPTTPERSESGG